MKLSKTLGVILAALLAAASFVVSIKLGIVSVLVLLITARILRGPSGAGGVIGVDHKNPPGTQPPQRNGGGIQTVFPPRGGFGGGHSGG